MKILCCLWPTFPVCSVIASKRLQTTMHSLNRCLMEHPTLFHESQGCSLDKARVFVYESMLLISLVGTIFTTYVIAKQILKRRHG